MYDSEYRKKYYQEHKEHLLELNRGYNRDYRLRHGEKIREADRRYYQEHKEELKERVQQRRKKLKVKVLTHYGQGKLACIICGESRIVCLSIDHINGGGNAHRRAIKCGSNNFYRWLKMQGYPEGYRTLCMNCQRVVMYPC